MDGFRDDYELSEDSPDCSAAARKRQLSAVWRFFERGSKDRNNKYSARCLTPGCRYELTQGKVQKMEAHVLAGCPRMSAAKGLEVREVLRREALTRNGSLGADGGAQGPEGSGTNTIERAGSIDYFVAQGKLPAGFKHRLDLQQLRAVACGGLSFNSCQNKAFKDWIALLRPNYTPASESGARLTNTRADFEIALILGQQLSTVFADTPVFVGCDVASKVVSGESLSLRRRCNNVVRPTAAGGVQQRTAADGREAPREQELDAQLRRVEQHPHGRFAGGKCDDA
jgi:hypothetical protein